MKILRIRLRNLNSLRGEWRVDLEDPAFTGSGIFAVTGPTGAGKTTIFDAVCLALYGRTPRLGSVSKGANEILSRGAGDCLAEVVFSVRGEAFVCQWSQRRARGRESGRLQAASHELSRAEDGEILSSSLSQTSARVAALTGIDFRQFTRTALLAQGEFDGFLKAEKSERAVILEAITGTELYSRLSRHVHERQRVEAARLMELNARRGALKLPPPEEETAMRVELERGLAQEEELSQRHARTAKVLEDHAFLARLRAEQERDRAALAEKEARLERLAGAASGLEVELTAAGEASRRAEEELETLLAGRLLREYRAQRDALQRELMLQRRIASLEEERRRLRPGEPCPLCGALEHPYAEGTALLLQGTEATLAALDKHIEAIERGQERLNAMRARELQARRNASEAVRASAEAKGEIRSLRERVEGREGEISARAAELAQGGEETRRLFEEEQQGLRALRDRISELNVELRRWKALREEGRGLADLCAAQEREAARWSALDGLIGSHDGRKFSAFAQQLTLDLVVEQANVQLRRMNNRYLLIPRAGDDLALDVIDGEQGGEIRPTSNLSGGESFIVSLALALGLSQLSSRRAQVDSLFLDEGFGSLDEEALEMALDALGEVRREGRMIGIISHVQALKDRIPAQIEVIPRSDGTSVLRGPGCQGPITR